jgi:hypothetical protein
VDVLKTAPLAACPGHVRIDVASGGTGRLVRLVTALFEQGAVRVLVGTQSLLGEGWDAPALNSLILASNTASFMLSNQMRGRAIRTNPRDEGKVANIWHLATLEPEADEGVDSIAARFDWGYLYEQAGERSDADLLQRRFRAFEGISNGDSTLIESGIGRLGVAAGLGPQAANERTFAIAADRAQIADRWARSLGEGEARSRVRETAAPSYAPRALSLHDTLHSLGWSALAAGSTAGAWELRHVSSVAGAATIGSAVAGAALVASLPRLFRAARLAWRNGSVERSLAQVGRAVLEALGEAGLANADEVADGAFVVRHSLDGRADIVLTGVRRATERHVMQAIAEVLGPVQNPRFRRPSR